MRSNDHFLRNMYIRIASKHSYLLVHHNQQQHQYHPSSTVDISLSSSLTVNVQETTSDQQLHDNYAYCIYSSPRGNFSAPHSNSNCRLSHLRKSFMRVCLYSSTRKTTSLATHTHIHITRITNLLLFLIFFGYLPTARRIHHATRQRRQPRKRKCYNDLRRTSLVRRCQ